MGRGSPIPPMLRRKIVEQYQKGVSQRKIAKSLKLSPSTVHNIIQRFRESGTISVRKGQGRKTILDPRDLRALRRHCITYRNATVMEITTWAQEYFQKTLSVNTIHRAIHRCRLKLYRSKNKPYLNMIQRRFLWAKANLKWTVAKWKTVLWSDESKFEVLFGKLGRHVIQTKEDKDNPSCYQRSVQKPASLMVWGCMSACGMGSLHIWKGTINAERYPKTNGKLNQCQNDQEFIKNSESGTEIYHLSAETICHGLSIAITGKWNTDFGIIHDGGWFDLAVYTINLNALLEFQSTEEHFSITTAMCNADVGHVQINFHGGASQVSHNDILLLFIQICPQFQKGIENIDKYLAANDVIQVDSYVYLNLSLTDSPVVFDNGFKLNVKGEFYSVKSPSEPPFSPHYFKLPWQEDYMLSVGVSEFCINSAAYAYLKSGVLSINITDGMIPKTSPIHLNTSQFGSLVPQQYSFCAKVYTDGQLLKGALEMKKLHHLRI
ncbi:hypothetical protein QTP86_007104 [Hemibagrus guttatus]|nr:hypothetical protein QTP86_007104 [Hemibagrus guttatus]